MTQEEIVRRVDRVDPAEREASEHSTARRWMSTGLLASFDRHDHAVDLETNFESIFSNDHGLMSSILSVSYQLLALCERATTDADLERPITLQRRAGPRVDAARDILDRPIAEKELAEAWVEQGCCRVLPGGTTAATTSHVASIGSEGLDGGEGPVVRCEP